MHGWSGLQTGRRLRRRHGSSYTAQPQIRACFTHPPCSRSSQSATLNRFNHSLRHLTMTPTPCDVYVVSSVAALEMAENLLVTVNTIVRGLPESELREMRDRLEVAFYTADDLLLSITISPGLESLTINGGMCGSLPAIVALIFPPNSVHHPQQRLYRYEFSHRYDRCRFSILITSSTTHSH